MTNEAKTAQPGHQHALVGIGRDKDVSLDNKERKIITSKRRQLTWLKLPAITNLRSLAPVGFSSTFPVDETQLRSKSVLNRVTLSRCLFLNNSWSLCCNSFTATKKNKIWFSEVFLWQPENLFVQVKFRFWPSDETRFENLKDEKMLKQSGEEIWTGQT